MREKMLGRVAVACLIAGAAFTSLTVMACGENLFRAGKGVAYRSYTAPLPGSILVVAATERESTLAAALAAAGHSVQTVGSVAELGEALRGGRYDVVLAYFRDRETVALQTADSGSTALYLPVTENRSESRLSRTLYNWSVQDDDPVKTYLKSIHGIVKDRRG